MTDKLKCERQREPDALENGNELIACGSCLSCITNQRNDALEKLALGITVDCGFDRSNGQGCDKCATCLRHLIKGATTMADRCRASTEIWEKSALKYLAACDQLRTDLAEEKRLGKIKDEAGQRSADQCYEPYVIIERVVEALKAEISKAPCNEDDLDHHGYHVCSGCERRIKAVLAAIPAKWIEIGKAMRKVCEAAEAYTVTQETYGTLVTALDDYRQASRMS